MPKDSPVRGGSGAAPAFVWVMGAVLAMALVVSVAAVGYATGRDQAFKEMAALAEDAYLRNQSGQGDVFTACLIEGWSQHDEFRKEWAARKVGAN